MPDQKHRKRQGRNKDQRQRKKRGLTVFPHVTYFGAKAIEAVLRSCVDPKMPDPTDKDWQIVEAILPELRTEIEACEDRHKKWEARNSRAEASVNNQFRNELDQLIADQQKDMRETGHGQVERSGASGANAIPDEECDKTDG